MSKFFIPATGHTEEPDKGCHYVLADDEKVNFYSLTSEAWDLGLTLLEDEVVVTSRRLIVTESKKFRIRLHDLLGCSQEAYSFRWDQQTINAEMVGGYEAKLVVPKCHSVCCAILFFLISLHLLIFSTPNVMYMSHDFVSALPAETVLGLISKDCKGLAGCKKAMLPALRAAGDAHKQVVDEVKKQSLVQVGNSTRRNRLLTRRKHVSLHAGRSFDTPQSDSDDVSVEGNCRNDDEENKVSTRSHCEDYSPWQDPSDRTCSDYAKPNWVLTCHGDDVQLAQLKEQVGTLRLTPLEACCSCGGSNKVARAKIIEEVAQKLSDVLLAIDNAEPDRLNMTPDMGALVRKLVDSGGQDILITAMTNVDNTHLQIIAVLARQLPGDVIFEDKGALAQVSEILKQLFHRSSDLARVAKEAAKPYAAQVIEKVHNSYPPTALDQVKEFLGNLGASSRSGIIHLLHLWNCLWRIFLLIVLGVSFYYIVMNCHLMHDPQTYILVRRHSHFFGAIAPMGVHKDLMEKRLHPEPDVVGFFIPACRSAEFAAALQSFTLTA
eukprot:TRINITY_DN25316_c0_g1_i1.p1 TRINITY_DN25316_c0_g1~~TRINITY_DN25316_c0_g1_i1.p1  ORF type:complete len:549 (+),score=52.95 TRINITY_DN25316_c0_g1_i1:106-1752(+)